MPCLFDKIKLTLFGSTSDAVYNQAKSLKSNFLRMCRLPLHKVRSHETNTLIQLLDHCCLYSTTKDQTTLTRDERLHDIAVLDFANRTISNWVDTRKQKSTRVDFVKQFQQSIQSHLHNIIKIDRYVFLNMRENNSVWLNPLYDKTKLQTYLSSVQQHYISSAATPTETTPLLSKHRNKLFYALTFPIINLLTDLNLFDFLCDSLNICSDLIRVF